MVLTEIQGGTAGILAVGLGRLLAQRYAVGALKLVVLSFCREARLILGVTRSEGGKASGEVFNPRYTFLSTASPWERFTNLLLPREYPKTAI